MKKKYCIARMEGRICSFLLDETGRALEIHVDEENSRTALGDIYIGRVQRVAKNIQAAFVETAPGLICYLPLSDLKAPLFTKKGPSPGIQQGDELVVQISREAMKTKAPAVTVSLCLQGSYVILEMGKSEIGVSRKLSENVRDRLRDMVETGIREAEPQVGELLAKCGVVVRTNAAEAEPAAVLEELFKLAARMKNIADIARYRTCYSCLYQLPPRWLIRLKGLPWNELEGVIIEDQKLYQMAAAYQREELPPLPILPYQDPLLPMAKLYSLEREWREAFSERVWLKSGAYLVIQPTEALTVIDVNTGKCETGKKKEETILKVNLEAARESARQLRLRNLSGIIIIDFINMKEEDAKKKLLEELGRCLVKDPVQARVIDMTKLDLVEITRKKVEKPLREHLFPVS